MRALAPAVVALATFVTFLPALRAGFVNWDDPQMFLDNPHYRGLGGRELRWMWSTTLLGEYMPVTWMSYGADWVLWRLDPFGYHLTGLLLHVLAALVVYGLALRLLSLGSPDTARVDPVGIRLGAALAALLFALHPLRAEAVGWVSARGTLLGGCLLLLATWVYVSGAARAGMGRMGRGRLTAATALFALALLARSTGLVLPGVLLVLDVYPLRRLGGAHGRWTGSEVRHVWWEKLPFVALGLAAIVPALLARLHSVDALHRGNADLWRGLGIAAFGSLFYLRQTLLPLVLSPIYELPRELGSLRGRFVFSAAVVFAITIALILARRRWPAGLTAWVTYLVLLAPLSGVVPLGLLQLAADRYSYVACVSWAVVAGSVVPLWRRWSRQGRLGSLVWLASLALVVAGTMGLGLLAWSQVGVWRDARTLWTYALTVAPASAVAHNNLATVDETAGRFAEAAARYRVAAALWPTYAPFRANLGRALARGGRVTEAVGPLRQAVALDPGSVEDRVSLGVVLFRQGETAEAAEQYRAALRLAPGSAVAHYNLSLALVRLGRAGDAAEHYRKAVELDPRFAHAETGGRASAAPEAVSE